MMLVSHISWGTVPCQLVQVVKEKCLSCSFDDFRLDAIIFWSLAAGKGIDSLAEFLHRVRDVKLCCERQVVSL